MISLLNEPNTFSPANVDASVMFRKWRDSKGKEIEYEKIVKKQVSRSKLEAEKENIKVPTTVDEYCVKSRPSRSETEDVTDFYDDDYADDLDDDDEEEDCMEYSEDSGNEET